MKSASKANPLDVLVDLGTERAVLGNALLDPVTVPLVAEVSPALYHKDAHRAVAAAIAALARRGEPVEPGTLQTELERAGRWADVGATMLAVLQEEATIASALPSYIAKLRELATRREFLQAAKRAAHQALDLAAPVDALLSGHVATVGALETLGIPDEVLGPEQIAEEMQTLTELPRTETGLYVYDAEGGLTHGDLHTLAARPRMGKTAAGLQIAHHVSHAAGLPALFVSAEMDRRQIELRLKGLASPAQTRASGLRIADPSSPSAGQLAAIIRRQVAAHAVSLVVVDHLQELRPDKIHLRRDLEIAEVCEALRQSAKALRVPILLLSQLNREIERRNSPAPILSDLRDGGAIEEKSATVTFLYSEEPGAEDRDDAVIPATFVQRKNRHEPARKWRAQFLRPHRFQGVA